MRLWPTAKGGLSPNDRRGASRNAAFASRAGYASDSRGEPFDMLIQAVSLG